MVVGEEAAEVEVERGEPIVNNRRFRPFSISRANANQVLPNILSPGDVRIQCETPPSPSVETAIRSRKGEREKR